jgi:hypothetical protein
MYDDAPQSDPMTAVEVLASYESEVCAVCGGLKRARTPFCATDFAALPMPARLALRRAPSSPQFAESFRAWLRHLQINPVRRSLMRSQAGTLPYRTFAEMESSGYCFSRRAQCGSRLCLAEILWVLTPQRAYLALDEALLQPHARTCKDPEWRTRRKQRLQEQRQQRRAQASARRRRR